MRIPTTAIGLLAAAGFAACGGAGEGAQAGEDKAVSAKPANVPLWRQPPDKAPGPEPEPEAGTARHFRLQKVAQGFRRANQILARSGDRRLFVVEQGGTVRVLQGGRRSGRPYLDLRQRIKVGGELGLLSVAFSRDGRRLVALFTDRRGDTRVASFPAGRDGADERRGKVLLAVDQPYENHKGGTVLFDERGRLLVSLGDGGSAFDPQQRGQDAAEPLGGILRLEAGRWKTVAFGLRNPWRMAFDAHTGMLWIGDVGQDRMEEIDAIWPAEAGTPVPNLGWAAYEAHLPLGRKALSRRGSLTWPVAAYPHRGGHCSVTGGSVYRGKAIRALRGRYVYGDFCRGTLWTLRAAAAEDRRGLDLRRETARLPGVTSFGTDRNGELLAVTIEGDVMRLIPDRRG